MKDLWHGQEQKRSSRREKKCTQHCSTQPAFIAWLEVKILSPKPQEKWIFVI